LVVGRRVHAAELERFGSLHDPTDPIGRLLFTTLSMIAEFEADLARARTRDGMSVARAKGRLGGKQLKFSARREAHLVELYHARTHTISELEELFPVTRSTIYRAVQRAGAPKPAPAQRK
jgi:DNA invertase Pin-like site-specific DNA recombinase